MSCTRMAESLPSELQTELCSGKPKATQENPASHKGTEGLAQKEPKVCGTRNLKAPAASAETTRKDLQGSQSWGDGGATAQAQA